MSVTGTQTSTFTPFRALKGLLILLSSLLAGACIAPPSTEVSRAAVEAPPDFPLAFYQQALADGQAVYEISSPDSLVRVYAYRAGALSRMGHDHVISSRTVEGLSVIAPAATKPAILVRADLYMPLEMLLVDEESLRREAGFNTEVSERARSGTRANMLSSLGASQFPQVQVLIEASLEQSTVAAARILLQVTVTLHGVSKRLTVPASVSLDNAGWHAEGRFSLQQTDFGIAPHSALGGALSVRDELQVDFDIYAMRLPIT